MQNLPQRLRRRFRSVDPSTPSSTPLLATLPVELVLHIFTLAAASSPSVLPLLARLCTIFHAWAVPRLYTTPNLRSPKTVKLFLRTVSKRPHLARRVRRLTLEGTTDGGFLTGEIMAVSLSRVFERCGNLTELELKGVAVRTLTHFAGAQNLTRLTFSHCLLADLTSTWRLAPFSVTLPSLAVLSLDHVDFEERTAESFFAREFAPRLERVEVRWEVKMVEWRGRGRRDLGPLKVEKVRPGMGRKEEKADEAEEQKD
ncbi:hypothetical protein JCM8097_004324 [Rhodosporidiobolus ruineniae]